MRKPIILLLAFCVFNLVFISLNSCKKVYPDDDCGGSYTSAACVDVNDVSLKSYHSGFDTLKSGVYGRQYAIVATYDVTQTVCFRTKKRDVGFINTAYACSPVPPSYRFNDAISEVQIISQDDFDSTHTAGTDITEYFTLPDYAAETLYDEYNEEGRIGSHAFLLEYLPPNKGVYKFTFKYKFASGRVIEKQDVQLNVWD